MHPSPVVSASDEHATSRVTITRGSIDDLETLEPVWASAHHWHASVMPDLAPYVSDQRTWAEKRSIYASLMHKPDTMLFIARVGIAPIGYALMHVIAAKDTWIADTWATGSRVAELESLSVLPAYRGRGVGSALLDMLDRELERLGIADAIVGALADNELALRLYRRRGFQPTLIYMSRFAGREADSRA
jgi:ribosomal protein S18 acetylase RimI-like enzyme